MIGRYGALYTDLYQHIGVVRILRILTYSVSCYGIYHVSACTGGADAADRLPGQDRETKFKVNLVVLEIVSDWAARNAPLSGGPTGCS